jgi:hypothetical protein
MQPTGHPDSTRQTFGPSTTLTFAGIKSEARLPRDKITKCVETIEAFLKRKKVRLQDLKSLIGLLNFAAVVITPGIAFLRRFYDLTRKVRFVPTILSDYVPRRRLICGFG